VTRAARSDWESWGLFDNGEPDPLLSPFGTIVGDSFDQTAPEPVEDSFTLWNMSVGKEWFLPNHQKIRASADYLGGADLDRFSRYRFSLFGDQGLGGFAGSGVRFDEGVIGRVGYAFNLFGAVRLSAAVDSARVEDDSTGVGAQSFTGVGISGNVPGPWKTVFNLSYGYALDSDIPDLEGQQEFLLLIFKLF